MWVEEKVSSTNSGRVSGDVEGFLTIVTILFETRIESIPVNGKIELDSTVSGEGIILEDESVVGDTILIVAIERK